MYWALSTLYSPPTDDCKAASEALSRLPSIVEGLTSRGYRLEPAGSEAMITDCEEHGREYTRLFILGDPSPLCPPYESVMLGYSQLMAEPALDVVRMYEKAGFRVSEDSPLPPEHIAVELEFMYVLVLLDENREAARLEQMFLEKHLARWAGRLASCIETKSGNRLFRALARLTRSFVAEDKRLLSNRQS